MIVVDRETGAIKHQDPVTPEQCAWAWEKAVRDYIPRLIAEYLPGYAENKTQQEVKAQ